MKMKLLKESSDRDMIKARVKYTGQSEYAKGDRFAEIVTPAENVDKVADILSYFGWDCEIFEDYEEAVLMVPVGDMNDFKRIMSYWKQAKREIK